MSNKPTLWDIMEIKYIVYFVTPAEAFTRKSKHRIVRALGKILGFLMSPYTIVAAAIVFVVWFLYLSWLSIVEWWYSI